METRKRPEDMTEVGVTERTWLLHAQYCDGPFYMGWWLYADLVKDGDASHSRRWNESIWFQYLEMRDDHARAVLSIAARHGAALPAPQRYTHVLEAAFVAAFPLGVLGHGPEVHPGTWTRTEVNTDAGLLDGWPYGKEETPRA